MISSILCILLTSLIAVQGAGWDPYGPPKSHSFRPGHQLHHPGGVHRPSHGHGHQPFHVGSHGPAYPAPVPTLPPCHPGGLDRFSLKSLRKLTSLIKSICKLCGKNVRHLAYASFYDNGDDYGDYDNDYHSDDDEDYDHYDDDDEDEEYEHYNFLRSLLGANETDASDSSSNHQETGHEDDLPTVTRAKRSIGAHLSSYNYFNNYYDPYGYQHQLPGYNHYLHQSYYGRTNPYYLYSKLAFIEDKLREKRRHKKNKKGGYGDDGHDKKDAADVHSEILGLLDNGGHPSIMKR